MPNLNKVQLMGNLTRDPEIRHTPKGTAICEFGIAINRTWKDDNDEKQEETTFVDLTFWGRGGENIAKFCKKGNPIYVEGRLQLDTWEDKASGQNRSKLKVVGESFQFLSSGKKEDDGQSQSSSRGREDQSQRYQSDSTQPNLTPPQSGSDESGDDIPF